MWRRLFTGQTCTQTFTYTYECFLYRPDDDWLCTHTHFQALEWLGELLDALLKTHVKLGDDSQETRTLLDKHKKFVDVAQVRRFMLNTLIHALVLIFSYSFHHLNVASWPWNIQLRLNLMMHWGKMHLGHMRRIVFLSSSLIWAIYSELKTL